MSSLRPVVVLSLIAALTIPHDAPAQSIERARQLFSEARYEAARKELLELQKAGVFGAEVAYHLGRIAAAQNDPEEALRHFERAVELDDGNSLYHYWLGSTVRELTPHVSKLKMPFYAHRLKKEFERAVALDSNQIDARFGIVQFYASAPKGMGRNRTLARQHAAEIARRSPMRGAIARGFIAEMEEDAIAEVAAYEEAIAAGPDSIAGYQALANAYARQGDAGKAFATIDRYVRRQREDRMALYHIGRISALTGEQLERGDSALTQFLEAPPADAYIATIADAHFRRGQIAGRRGDGSAARRHFTAAVRLDPRSEAGKALKALP